MQYQIARRVLLGIGLIAFGGLFLLGQIGIVDFDLGDIISTYWPVVLIYIGLTSLIGSGSFMWGLFMILLGAGFLLRNLGIGNMDMEDYFKLLIPAMIILFGLRMIFRPDRPSYGNYGKKDYSYKYEYKYEYDYNKNAPPADPLAEPDPQTHHSGPHEQESSSHSWSHGSDGPENRSGFIGDLYLGQDYWELRPMNVSHFIGDTIIDLTKAQVPFGETRLNVSAFIGDVKVFVPNDMDVEFRVDSSSFLGDITIFERKEGGFLRSLREETAGYPYADKKIRLQCNLFIGDIHVQRVG